MSINAIVDQPLESENRREAARWRIRLELPEGLAGDPGVAGTGDGSSAVVIHDISTAGMLIETRSKLKIGQSVMLSLPDADKVIARIVWQNETLFGCRFEETLPQGVVSAIRLRNPGAEEKKPRDEEAATAVQAPQTADNGADTGVEGFPERLRRLRKERGLSRTALSEQTGLSKPTLWGWETGRTTPRRENLLTLANLFGLTEQQLLYGSDEATPLDAGEVSQDDRAQPLKDVIEQAKARIAEAAGVTRFKVRISIDY